MSRRNGNDFVITPEDAHDRYGEDPLAATKATSRPAFGVIGDARIKLADSRRELAKLARVLDTLDYLQIAGMSLDSTLEDAARSVLNAVNIS